MHKLNRIVLIGLFVLLTACTPTDNNEESGLSNTSSVSGVIEIVTLTLKEGVSYSDFAPIDSAIETEHVS